VKGSSAFRSSRRRTGFAKLPLALGAFLRRRNAFDVIATDSRR
jgi:hypothetical protein